MVKLFLKKNLIQISKNGSNNLDQICPEDLKGIAEYIARDSVNYARIQVRRITIKTEDLKLQPHSGRIVPEVNEENVRELIEGNYRIIYEIVDDYRIDILTTHHSSRDLNRRKFL